jgi:hypothetical protein
MEELSYLVGWENEGIENDGPIKYTRPDTEESYIFEYGLNFVTSTEMQVFLELEHWLDEFTRNLEKNGEETYKGDAKHWRAVDPHLTQDQIDIVGKAIKSEKYSLKE